MMRPWVRYLPWALVVWLIKRDEERIHLSGTTPGYLATAPFDGEIYSWKV